MGNKKSFFIQNLSDLTNNNISLSMRILGAFLLGVGYTLFFLSAFSMLGFNFFASSQKSLVEKLPMLVFFIFIGVAAQIVVRVLFDKAKGETTKWI